MKLRVGLIGLGDAWESRYRSALRSLADRYEVRAVCEQVAHRAQQAAAEFGATPVDGYRALCAREDIDAVLMLAPQWYGWQPILAASDAGKAIFCAAALDLDPMEARRIKVRVDEQGVAFMAGFAHRHNAATLRLKELLATQLGAPRLLFCHARRPARDPNSEVTQSRYQAAGVRDLMELVDWCCYVVGSEPTSVLGASHQAPSNIGGEDYEVISLDFSDPQRPGSGITAQISCGRYASSQWPEAVTFRPPADLQIACENGIAFVDLPSTLIWFDDAGRHRESLDSERPVGEQLLVQFHRDATSLVRSISSLEDAYRALSIVSAARTSDADGRRVTLRSS